MTLSMTGFGKAEVQTEQLFINIEIRSLNSKFLDLNLKIPSIFKELELPIRSILKKEVKRGKIELTLHYERNNQENNLIFNQPQITKYYLQLRKIKEELNDENNIDLISQILKFPDIFNSEKNSLEQRDQKLILDGVHKACESLNDYRKKEGGTLAKVIKDYAKNIQDQILKIEKFEKERLPEIKHKLNKAIDELELSDKFDHKRLEQELIYYSEKIDITEEKVRLNEHCNYFLNTLNTLQAGKKLGFIAQEMGREINTLGSKAHHLSIQKIVVEMKNELEKIKEQVLNIL
tara:strand:- start:19199 stop:20071 length:873 start_codon:yes stop_codon:yes gene_type:complete